MYLTLFIIYSIFGWILEVICNSVIQNQFVNNHFLLIPLCPMYGFAGILIFYFSKNIKNYFSIFIISIIISILVEYFTSYCLELIFNIRWWDYSKKIANLHGRINLINTIEFGLLGTIGVYFSRKLVSWLNNYKLSLVNIFIISILIVDTTISSYYTYNISKNNTN
ncbi:MAG: putative ABC transporter permease, partial [bacterium]|nr:putative ABC transporter permease [bacterium]